MKGGIKGQDLQGKVEGFDPKGSLRVVRECLYNLGERGRVEEGGEFRDYCG